ncbi:MAG: hypothetical protein KKE37_13395 [Verrucomicrobia bacterium]|nr:hypothetical protein [Verrucomicrobiota bacterium]MBU4289607.1 hypothetical protein [Verrucomicrobiota bacterium]MBU4430334.1 hypothetical protein [Verrucomicrobiota bacterium]MCG2680201.1 hypothetical protein [Kiritimatiellia bacterium]
MKYTDQYEAKYRIWATTGKVYPLPAVIRIPGFRSIKFNSCADMNAWKRKQLEKLAEERADHE